MKFHYTDLETCHDATGMVIIIDVIRAFTNAAFAFGQGAEKIIPVSSVDEALELKRQLPNAMACGEVGGLPPEEFDFGNSPAQILSLDLRGKTLIQRTGAGTQAVTRSVNAKDMLAASFVVAGATVRYAQKLSPKTVTFVVSGQTSTHDGEEDLACAEYLEALLREKSPDVKPFLECARRSSDAQLHYDPTKPQFLETDILHCTSVDKFNFAMPIEKENGRHAMRPVFS